MGIRLVVIDDNPHVRWEGRVYPANATFQQFVAGLLDLPGAPVATITSCVPLRDATADPGTFPLDPRIRVVGTAPFAGIEGYLRRLPTMLGANRAILRTAIAEADLAWIKVPASNAGLAAALALRSGVPRFVWVAGSAAEVGTARYRGAARAGAGAVGLLYDGIGRVAGLGGHRVVVGDGIVDADGMVTSLVARDEILDPGARPWTPSGARANLVWAGRLTAGKGLEALLEAVGADPALRLTVLGGGPDRERLEAAARALGASERVTWVGHVADRVAYLHHLAVADAFVFPSRAEGFPKVVLDAMAVGRPVLSTGVGALGNLVRADLVEPVERSESAEILAAWRRLLETPPTSVEDRRRRAMAFALAHTREAELARLVGRWRGWWPALPWEA